MGALGLLPGLSPKIVRNCGELELHNDVPAPFPVCNSLGLALYLAVTGQPHTRASLVALLWPDADDAHGLFNLRQTLLCVRLALAPDGDAHIRTAGDLVPLDLTRFAAATLMRTSPDEALAALCSYAGPLLHHLEIDDAPNVMAWLADRCAHWAASFGRQRVGPRLDLVATRGRDGASCARHGAGGGGQHWRPTDALARGAPSGCSWPGAFVGDRSGTPATRYSACCVRCSNSGSCYQTNGRARPHHATALRWVARRLHSGTANLRPGADRRVRCSADPR